MRRGAWLLSGVALLPLMLAHATAGGWGAGGALVAVDTTARTAAASAMTLAQGAVQQSKNLSDVGNASVALGNLHGIPSGLIGAPSGVAALDGNRLLPPAQVPFGTTSNTVADGGTLAATSTLASSALQPGGNGNGLVFTSGSSGTTTTGATLAAQAGSAIPSSMLGAASGVATLDANKHVTGTQIPFGTTPGTVTDGGVFTSAMQSTAATFLKVSDASSGVVHALGLNGTAEMVGRSLAARAGDVWNVADHGADRTATNDNMALVNGLAYAAAHPYTVIRFPRGTWALSVSSSQPGFAIPSTTVLEGAANNGTILTWNDQTAGYSLLTDTAPVGGGRNNNIVLRNLVVQGSWGPCAGCSWTSGGNNAIFLYLVDDVTLDHVTSRYSGAFGMTVRASTNVKLLDDAIYYSASDGINLDDDSGIFARNFSNQHTADDCFSAHSDIYDQGGVRRNIQIVGGYCFDTHGIDIASPVSLSISDTIIDSFKVAAIVLSGSPAATGATEGNSEGQDVTIDNVTMTNGIATYSSNSSDPANFDPKDPTDAGLNYVIIGARSPRPGNLTYTPGENGTSPYPYTLSNSNASAVPVPTWRTIRITNSIFGRHFGATNTTAIPNWGTLGQGGITTKDGIYTPSLNQNDLIGNAITIFSPNVLRNLEIEGDTFEGLSTALSMSNANVGHLSDFAFNRNRMIDMFFSCADIESPGIMGEMDDNWCNADPYFASGQRSATGGWNYNNGYPSGFIVTVPGITARRNTFQNVWQDTNVNPSDPTTGDLFEDNIDLANPTVIGSYSAANGGIGLIHQAGFKLEQIGTNPADSSWDKVLNVPVNAAPAMPTSGFWMPGEFVRNSAPSSSNTALGWLRVTVSNNGSTYPYAASTNNASGTDWIVK